MAAERRRAGVRRTLDLLRLYARMDLLWITSAMRTALAWYFSDTVIALGLVTTTFLIAERFDGIGAWSKLEVVFMLGYALVARGLVDAVFGQNISAISRRIGRGQLDHLLVQPLPLWQSMFAEGFAPFSASGMVIVGGGLVAYAARALALDVGIGWLALLALNLISSTGVILAFSFAWGSVAFWAPRSAEEINSSTMRLVYQLHVFPLDGLATPLLISLLSVVPVGFVAWFPARALLGIAPSGFSSFATPLAALLFLALALAIFLRGMRHYGRTGSSRYLAYGHRR